MSAPLELEPIAQLNFVASGRRQPGWYLRYEVHGRPVSERLAIETGADAFGALSEAAEFLGCSVEQIEFDGPIWPKPLDGMVDADETLEYVTEPTPETTNRQGEWRLLTQSSPGPQQKNDREGKVDARRSTRRSSRGVLLYEPVYGRVLNWSEAGMGIEIGQPLPVETRKLFLAKGKRSEVELYGEVRWCHKIDGDPFGQPPTYHAGVSLIS